VEQPERIEIQRRVLSYPTEQATCLKVATKKVAQSKATECISCATFSLYTKHTAIKNDTFTCLFVCLEHTVQVQWGEAGSINPP